MTMTRHILTVTFARTLEKFRLCAPALPSYLPVVDTITIKDLGVLCRIGVPDEERSKPQRLLITVEMSGDFSRAAQSDEIAHTINYYDVSLRITSLCETHSFKLIEKLAHEIGRILLDDFRAERVSVEVKKYILSNARHVSFRLTRERH